MQGNCGQQKILNLQPSPFTCLHFTTVNLARRHVAALVAFGAKVTGQSGEQQDTAYTHT